MQIRSRISLLGMNEAGKEDWVADEENGRIVADQIPISLLRVIFHGKSPWIANSVGTARFAGHGGETEKARSFLANFRKYFGFCVHGDVMGDFKFAIGTGAMGMNLDEEITTRLMQIKF